MIDENISESCLLKELSKLQSKHNKPIMYLFASDGILGLSQETRIEIIENIIATTCTEKDEKTDFEYTSDTLETEDGHLVTWTMGSAPTFPDITDHRSHMVTVLLANGENGSLNFF